MRTRTKRTAAVISRCIEPLEDRMLLAATQVVFLNQPTDSRAGVSVDPAITVAIEDGTNHVVTSSTASVTLAIKSGTGTTSAALSGTKTVAAVNGIATFTGLSIDLAGD